MVPKPLYTNLSAQTTNHKGLDGHDISNIEDSRLANISQSLPDSKTVEKKRSVKAASKQLDKAKKALARCKEADKENCEPNREKSGSRKHGYASVSEGKKPVKEAYPRPSMGAPSLWQ